MGSRVLEMQLGFWQRPLPRLVGQIYGSLFNDFAVPYDVDRCGRGDQSDPVHLFLEQLAAVLHLDDVFFAQFCCQRS